MQLKDETVDNLYFHRVLFDLAVFTQTFPSLCKYDGHLETRDFIAFHEFVDGVFAHLRLVTALNIYLMQNINDIKIE